MLAPRLLLKLSATTLLSAITVIGGCSESSPDDTPTATGGSVQTGGTTSGGTPTSSGATATTGGTTSNPTGGAPSPTGGTTSPTGGKANSTGGNPPSGTTGGSPSETGGASNAGSGNAAGAPSGTGGGATVEACPTMEEELFSFFMISNAATIRESGSADGFGGDLGGLEGADAICQRVAEFSSPCQTNKVWRAFLSTSTVDAIDRIGKGPWHDRLGRLFGNNIEELLNDRPTNAASEIKDDFPNEDGVPNMNPNGVFVDNHQTLTGSGIDGRAYTQDPDASGGGLNCGDNEEWTVEKATCWGWTTAEPVGCPRVGHSWPRQGSGINWISVWNESGCKPGGRLVDEFPIDDGSRRVGTAGGYGGWYCFAVTTP